MDTPVIYKASSITKNSFVANWQAVTGADKYYLDVSEKADFNTFLSGYNAKELANNYEEITGLSDLSHYYYRVKASNSDDTDVSDYSFVMEVVTGFHVAGMSIEFGNLVADLFNVQGITIEVSTDFNFQAIIRDNSGSKVNSAKCLIIRDGWKDKGTWNPLTDPDPSTPSEGDFYTIAATGDNDITGETEEFNTTDLLVYLDATWQIKKHRLIYSDSSGVANMNIDYLVDNLFVVSKSGYETERQILNYVAGYHQYDIKLFPVKSVIHHSSGHAINIRPEERENKFLNDQTIPK